MNIINISLTGVLGKSFEYLWRRLSNFKKASWSPSALAGASVIAGQEGWVEGPKLELGSPSQRVPPQYDPSSTCLPPLPPQCGVQFFICDPVSPKLVHLCTHTVVIPSWLPMASLQHIHTGIHTFTHVHVSTQMPRPVHVPGCNHSVPLTDRNLQTVTVKL